MPRRIKTDDSPETGLFQVEPDELDEVLSGLPSQDSTISLYRVNPQGKPAFITEFSPLDWSLEGIKNTYGGGKYKYVAKSSGGPVRQGMFEIEGEATTGRVNSKPVYKRYINGKLVFSKPEDAELVINPPIAAPVGADINTLLLMELKALREALSRPVEPSTSKKDLLEELRMMKELFGGNQKDPIQDFSKVAIDLIKQGMDVANNAENGGSPWVMIFEKVLPTVQQAIHAFTIQQQRGAVPRAIQPPPPDGITGPSTPDVPMTGFDSIADKLRAYLPTFLSAASANSDPGILVELTAPNIPEPDRGKVIEWLSSDKWFIDLCSLHPIIAGQRAWWGEYNQGLLATLKNPSDTESHDNTE